MGPCPRCGDDRRPGWAYCGPCQSAFAREWEVRNPERAREVKRRARARWRAANPEKDREQRRAAAARQRAKVLAARALLPPVPPRSEKRCRGCRVVRPVGDFEGATGREARCGACRAAQQAWVDDQRRGAAWGEAGVKGCSRCGEVKPLDEFVAHKGKRDGRSSFCRPCGAARRSEWGKANRDKVKSGRRQTRPTPAEKRCRSCHETKLAAAFSRDKSEADGLDRKCKECRRRWTYKVDRLAIYAREGGRCHICRKPVAVDNFHVEHLFPQAAGGTDDPSNLAVAHPVCNMRKGGRVAPVQLRLGA